MSDLRTLIARMREIEQAATPGRWRYVNDYVSWIEDCKGVETPQCDEDWEVIAASRNLFAALLDVATAADDACDGATCDLEDERLRYETWQHNVGTMRAMREALARLHERMEAERG